MIRVLVTCSRSWADWVQARAVLELVRMLSPDAVLVSGHARKGDQDLERIWEELGGTAERYPARWRNPCRKECKKGHRQRRAGVSWCPAQGHYRNQYMAELPDVRLCLAFIGPCEDSDCRVPRPHPSHGATDCAHYAEHTMKIPTRRYEPAPIPTM